MDVVSLEPASEDIIASRPIYAGKALIDVKINSEKKSFYNKTKCI